ncbi:Poly-beta-1,6-N-acetyl-D-glucosamine synthase [bacterium HR30]|nr:Poly-beta-1,6-N-acetyl-D-glucosamine synthase [bacterium HR30]
MPAPEISVIIATRNRVHSLRRVLETLEGAEREVSSTLEMIIADNGSTDATPALLAEWCQQAPKHRKMLHVPDAGKARALNAACRIARGSILAFTDDDVEVPTNWLRAVAEFANRFPSHAAATGPVKLPPRQRSSDITAMVEFYRTIPLFDLGSQPQPSKHLYGCNMAVRKPALEAVSGFDPRLGPGASGLHEDGDLARRLRAAGFEILYWPAMEMFHIVEPERLTWEYFCRLHRADARSRWIRDGNLGLGYALRHWLGAAAVLGLWTVVGNRYRRMRARGRLLSHTEYLRLCWAARRSKVPCGKDV